MDKYDISVIIPCYNCEKTISSCIESVINQTFGFENIQLILVDDKSKDNTKNILEDYSKKYDNISTILLDKNSGYCGKPRNIGIKNAIADYIMFLDSDDKYDSEICEKLFNEIQKENADMVTCNYINNDSIGSFYCRFDFKNGKKLDDKIIIENDNLNYFKIEVVWCSIFKKSIITDNNIKFPENKIAEDLWFTINYLLNSEKAVYLNKYYGYLRLLHKDSITQTISIEKHNGQYDILEKCIDVFPKKYNLSYRFKHYILYGYIQLLTNNIISINPKEAYNFLKRIRNIETKMKFNERLMMPFNIINWFVMRENYKIAMFLLKTIYIYIKMNFVITYIEEYYYIKINPKEKGNKYFNLI